MEAQVLDSLTLYDLLCSMQLTAHGSFPELASPLPPEPVAIPEITPSERYQARPEKTLFRSRLLWRHGSAACDLLLAIHGPRSRHGLRHGWQQAPIGRCPSSPLLLAPTGNRLR